MIAESTIQDVYQTASIVEVIGQFISLKKSGSNYCGSSPFVEEKTPSFMVSPTKQIFKCFSSGIGGNVTKYLMEAEKMSFPEAIKWLAAKYNITVEEDGKQLSEEQKDHKTELQNVIRATANAFVNQLKLNKEAADYCEKRGLTKDDLIQWQIGYAPDDYKFLYNTVVQKGVLQPTLELGLCRKKENNTYDFFRHRIMFPIHNHVGQLVAFGGRALSPEEKAKYINSTESKLYNKSNVLYGLNFAQKAISQDGKVFLTEGFLDVIAMHRAGITNTVATCGTALTPFQAKLLKRYCSHVVLLYDGDAPGQKAILKALPILLKAGFKVEQCTLPNGQDPDDLINTLEVEL